MAYTAAPERPGAIGSIAVTVPTWASGSKGASAGKCVGSVGTCRVYHVESAPIRHKATASPGGGSKCERSLSLATARASQGCADTLRVERIETFQPGQPVTISASCDYPMVDVMGFLPGSMTFTSEFTSPLDPNRGIEGITP